ncbi:MAG: hypothetical protein E7427_04930 [Ruminococcaceae bacterium]|nr:hypothetical protein [Oscillospiraceae bacterium]
MGVFWNDTGGTIMKKRLLSLLLIACLCLALLPAAAVAAEPEYAAAVNVADPAGLLNVLPSTPNPNPIPVARLTTSLTLNDPNHELHSMGKLIIPSGVTLTVDGVSTDAEFEIQSGGAIEVKNGGVLATTMGGNIENHGTITVEKGASIVSQMGGSVVNEAGGTLKLDGTFRCGSHHDKTDDLWFENSGTVSGNGDLIVCDVDGSGVNLDAMIEGAMRALKQTQRYGDGYWDDVNIFKEVEVSSDTELKAAFPKDGRTVAGEHVEGNMDVIAVLRKDVTVTDGDVQTMGKLIVPEGITLTVAEGGNLEIGIENNGTVAVRSGGTLETTMGGDIVNHGSLTVASGATLTSQKGSSVVNKAGGTLKLDGTFRCGVVYNIESDTDPVQVWFKNEDDSTVTGSGTVTAYQALPEDPVDLDAAAAQLQQTLWEGIAVTEIPAAPALPEAGSFTGSKEITITCAAVGASVYYTTDDTDPSVGRGIKYTDPFTIDSTTTVRAIAVLKGESSDIASATYTLRSADIFVGGSSKTYKITVAAAENGTAAASRSTAAEGEKITVTAAPAEGYALDSITVKGEKAGSVTVTDGTFTMPADDVTVTVRFKENKTEPRPVQTFTDVKPDDWFYEGVKYVADQGLMNGVADGLFDPNGTTTRGMIVTILYRLEGSPAVTGENPFTDVAAGQWYSDAVIWAAENKIVEGFEDGTFRPNEPITREQLAAILYRYAQSKGQGFTGLWSFQLDFPDAGDVSDWANEAMSWMVMNGVINGKDGRLVPKGSASRAETAAMLMRFLTL